MPFLAEEIYGALKPYQAGVGSGAEVAESVHLAEWPVAPAPFSAKEKIALIEGMAEVRRLASIGLAKRVEAGVKVRQPLAKLTIKTEKVKLSPELRGILADEVNVKEVAVDAAIADEVALDAIITPALREEGVLREVARMVQGLRQEAGLQPKDVIALLIDLPEDARNIILKNETALRTEVGAKLVEYGKSEKFTAEVATKLEGQEAWVALRKV
jgi:isoleucyl-tRNA synthetase